MRPFWLGLVLLAACSGAGSETVASADSEQIAADRVLYGTRLVITVDGVRNAIQEADSMYVFEDSTTAQMYGLHLMMYDSIGRKTADLRSLRGDYNQRTQKMVARGAVVLVLSDGRKVETEELNYDPESHRIWSDVSTKMTDRSGSVSTYETFATDDEFKNPSGTGLRGKVPGLKL